MISGKMNDLLNRQVQKEFYSAYLYLGFEAYFQYQNLDGFANFFHVQVQEERDHAMKIFNYITEAGGKVKLYQVDEPEDKFNNPEEIFDYTLKHEQEVTKSIYNLVDNAIAERDHGTNSFLQWFVTEQIEEEATVDKVLRKLQLIKNDPHALLMLDAELATRVYTPPVAEG